MTQPHPGTFPSIQFSGDLRPSQRDVVEIARAQLTQGERRLHIVAPPGSGKTVLGLYLWAECLRVPALVLSPNSAIQMQWAARTSLFAVDGKQPFPRSQLVSTDPQTPRLLTSLTYQSVTLPRRGDDDLDEAARRRWVEHLIVRGQAEDPDEATVWIEDLAQNNPAYHAERLASFRKEVRDEAALEGEAVAMLHASSRETLQRIRDAGVGLIILDECHHLLGHWGRVLADAHDLLNEPVILGLTATPPDESGKSPQDVERYREFFGPVDYEVPVPAVVKDGYLAPYQDLACFVRPAAEELRYIAGVDSQLYALVEKLCEPARGESLVDWVARALAERRLGSVMASDWRDFERRDPAFAAYGRAFLQRRGRACPEGVPPFEQRATLRDVPDLELLGTVLDRYVRHRLRRSADPADHELAVLAISELRLLGIQVTDTGTQPCASPVARVMAYSRSKADAVVTILKREREVLGEDIRAVVVTDFEKTSAVSAEIRHLFDDEAGGAVAVFKALLQENATDALNPVLVTGSTVLVDDDLADRFESAAVVWLKKHGCDVRLEFHPWHGFHQLTGSGTDWSPRVYVQMVTDLFQQGLTQCLVGTRGLLGEGWDANRINVLIDLTCVTTSMTVNQLRGRSIRLDPLQPEKVANNWDVVCVAPEFAKGLDDYSRFCRKHATIFGVTDDGAIEKGVGHVHAAFTELKPEGIEASAAALNTDMLNRAGRRAEARAAWRIGEPYHPEPVRTLEVRPGGGGGGFPPFPGRRDAWSDRTLTAAIATAVLEALRETGLITQNGQAIQLNERDGSYLRVFLNEATEDESSLFSESLEEAMGPIDRPRYVIPRHVDHFEETLLSRLLPDVLGRYFRKSRRQMVMLHAVPSALARNRDLVNVYQTHWNRHVSPGDAQFAHRGAGAELLESCRRRELVPDFPTHQKEVFLNRNV